MVKAVAVSSKHRPTNTPTPSSTRPASSAPTTLASTSSTSSATSTHRQMPNVPRPPARKLMPSEALGRYLTYEDRRDRSFMALLAAFSTVVRPLSRSFVFMNNASCSSLPLFTPPPSSLSCPEQPRYVPCRYSHELIEASHMAPSSFRHTFPLFLNHSALCQGAC